MMIAHHEAVRLEVVERLAQIADLARGGVVRRQQLVLLAGEDRLRVCLRQEGEGLRDDELEREAQQAIEHAGLGRGRVFLQPQHAGIARAAGAADLERLPAEDQPVGVERGTDRTMHERHRKALAGDELMQELHRFGEDQALALVKREPAWTVALERGDEVAGHVLKLLQRLGVDLGT